MADNTMFDNLAESTEQQKEALIQSLITVNEIAKQFKDDIDTVYFDITGPKIQHMQPLVTASNNNAEIVEKSYAKGDDSRKAFASYAGDTFRKLANDVQKQINEKVPDKKTKQFVKESLSQTTTLIETTINTVDAMVGIISAKIDTSDPKVTKIQTNEQFPDDLDLRKLVNKVFKEMPLTPKVKNHAKGVAKQGISPEGTFAIRNAEFDTLITHLNAIERGWKETGVFMEFIPTLKAQDPIKAVDDILAEHTTRDLAQIGQNMRDQTIYTALGILANAGIDNEKLDKINAAFDKIDKAYEAQGAGKEDSITVKFFNNTYGGNRISRAAADEFNTDIFELSQFAEVTPSERNTFKNGNGEKTGWQLTYSIDDVRKLEDALEQIQHITNGNVQAAEALIYAQQEKKPDGGKTADVGSQPIVSKETALG